MMVWEWNIVFPDTQIHDQTVIDKVIERYPQLNCNCWSQKQERKRLQEKYARELLSEKVES